MLDIQFKSIPYIFLHEIYIEQDPPIPAPKNAKPKES